MDNRIAGIKVESDANFDINGVYSRKSAEEDCEYVGMPKEEWMNYIFGHLFADYARWTTKLEEAFAEKSITSMTVNLWPDVVTITKLYR